jgi:hypothetical protein
MGEVTLGWLPGRLGWGLDWGLALFDMSHDTRGEPVLETEAIHAIHPTGVQQLLPIRPDGAETASSKLEGRLPVVDPSECALSPAFESFGVDGGIREKKLAEE